jgi:GDPmannose 4,6-dehydratase
VIKALIIGVTGQDGSLLAKNLLDRGIEVHGTFRRGSSDKFWRINELGIREQIFFHNYNIGNELAFSEVLKDSSPDLIFSLAGESFTSLSFEEPKQFMNINIDSTVEQLESIRANAPKAKVFFAGSSEIFGKSVTSGYLDENSNQNPNTPYGISKLAQKHLVRLFREKYNLELYYGILFPHESPYRSTEFVTRKIALGLVRTKFLGAKPIQLGDLSMQRDWGSAVDYVDWMYQLLQTDTPGEFVFGSGQNHTVEEFLYLCSSYLNLELAPTPIDQKNIVGYVDKNTGVLYAESNVSRFSGNRFSYGAARPQKLFYTIGLPRVTSLKSIAGEMVKKEISRIQISS